MTDLPADPFDRGVLLEQRDDPKGARVAYLLAVEQSPGHAEALASLAWLDAQAGDRVAARTWSERALTLDAANVLARMALAFADLQDKQLDAAGTRLAGLYADSGLTAVNRSIVLGLIGDWNDAQGDTARAFKAYGAANAQLASLYPESGVRAIDHACRLADWFGRTDPRPWQSPPAPVVAASDPRGHIFLVGFPRSGTTLLETVLAGHPEVVSLEEKDSLARAADAFLTSNEGLDRLANISPDEAQNERETYWSAVRGFGVEPQGKIFIDKMPLATVLLPLISQLFPNARVLFAVRDPRDVVLSCFRRRFGMNAAMYELLTLDGAAAYYDTVMRLAELYRALLPIPLHEVRYERLVEDFEGTARAVCDFAGLDWTPAMADIAATARARGITTPSAAQLAAGLNRDGQGAWRRYRERMAPALPVLEPWVERFGYEASSSSRP
jgi:hypothetical protein